MKKILGLVGLTGDKGLIGLVSEKTGKISFKRVGAVMIIGWIVKSIQPQDLTTIHAIIIVGCLASIALPKIFSKD